MAWHACPCAPIATPVKELVATVDAPHMAAIRRNSDATQRPMNSLPGTGVVSAVINLAMPAHCPNLGTVARSGDVDQWRGLRLLKLATNSEPAMLLQAQRLLQQCTII